MILLCIVQVYLSSSSKRRRQPKFEDYFKSKQLKWISDIQVYVLRHQNDCYVKFNVSEVFVHRIPWTKE